MYFDGFFIVTYFDHIVPSMSHFFKKNENSNMERTSKQKQWHGMTIKVYILHINRKIFVTTNCHKLLRITTNEIFFAFCHE